MPLCPGPVLFDAGESPLQGRRYQNTELAFRALSLGLMAAVRVPFRILGETGQYRLRPPQVVCP